MADVIYGRFRPFFSSLLGACSAQELLTPVTNGQIIKSMQDGIHLAENTIRKNITHYQLTQQQFDALVSFVYNVGSRAALGVLRLLDSGNLIQAINTMMLFIHATVYGKDGKPLRDKNGRIITRILPGLMTRRREETAPFRACFINSTPHNPEAAMQKKA